MDLWHTAALVAATVTAGIAAGVYQLYAFVIMPGLGRTDDRTFVWAFQEIDRKIVGPYLFVFFFGPVAFSIVAAALSFDTQSELLLVGGAVTVYFAMAALTIAVNVPLNNGIKAAGNPDDIADVSEVRARFQETRWVRSNNARVVGSTIAFGLLVWALILHAS